MKTHPLVMIEWVDSYGCSRHWQDLDAPSPSPMLCKSVGWLYHDGKDCKLVIPHFADGDGHSIPDQGFGDLTIPTSSVSKIVRLVPERKKMRRAK